MMFKLIKTSGKARLGVLNTKSGKVETPCFMPVATKGAAKYVSPMSLLGMGANTIILNSFLLYLKPGLKILNMHSGIHGFMKYPGVIFSDSGGFQMTRKTFHAKTDNDGVWFRDPFSGDKVHCTPEWSMNMQVELDSDVAMCLDDVAVIGSTLNKVKRSVMKTYNWGLRCKEAHDKLNSKQLLFGILQGGTFSEQRIESAKLMTSIDFDGYAIGGLAIGEKASTMFEMVKVQEPFMPADKIRYLMGLGGPREIVEAVNLGMDIFDSAYPTLVGRHGKLFTRTGDIDINKKTFIEDMNPIDSSCKCYVCSNFTRSYLHHLHRMREPLGQKYNSLHNLYFLQQLMKDIRKAISAGKFKEFYDEFNEKYT